MRKKYVARKKAAKNTEKYPASYENLIVKSVTVNT